jgi:hypothetical protein
MSQPDPLLVLAERERLEDAADREPPCDAPAALIASLLDADRGEKRWQGVPVTVEWMARMYWSELFTEMCWEPDGLRVVDLIAELKEVERLYNI